MELEEAVLVRRRLFVHLAAEDCGFNQLHRFNVQRGPCPSMAYAAV